MMQDSTWKEGLLNRCAEIIANLPDEMMEDSTVTDELEPPSLYQFYEEFLAMRSELRKINRRTVDAFGSFGTVLEGMQEDSSKLRNFIFDESKSNGKGREISTDRALALIDIADRFARLKNAYQNQTKKRSFKVFINRDFLRNQQAALSMLEDYLLKVFSAFGIHPQPVVVGDEFDPLVMKAVGCDYTAMSNDGEGSQPLLVIQVDLVGFRLGNQVLRPTEVTLSRKRS
jgi:molecular chaperone GrpE (heat shock protein)